MSVEASAPPGTNLGILIFVVDDQQTIGWVVEGILNLYNYRVNYFEDPREALRALQKADPKPQLLLTDYAMGPMNGLELIRQCKEIHPGLRCVLYSGSVSSEIIREGDTCPDEFLGKPFQANELIQTVQKALS